MSFLVRGTRTTAAYSSFQCTKVSYPEILVFSVAFLTFLFKNHNLRKAAEHVRAIWSDQGYLLVNVKPKYLYFSTRDIIVSFKRQENTLGSFLRVTRSNTVLCTFISTPKVYTNRNYDNSIV